MIKDFTYQEKAAIWGNGDINFELQMYRILKERNRPKEQLYKQVTETLQSVRTEIYRYKRAWINTKDLKKAANIKKTITNLEKKVTQLKKEKEIYKI